MPAIASRMRVFHRKQLKIILPIRTFLIERWIAKANLDPLRDATFIDASRLHVLDIFTARDRVPAQRSSLDCAQKIGLLT